MNGTIVLFSVDPHLSLTRRLVLESAGFTVFQVSELEEAKSAIELQKPQMIILCQSLGSAPQNRFTEELQKAPNAPHILSLRASLLDPPKLIALCRQVIEEL